MKRNFGLRVTYVIILAALTICYIVGDVVQNWRDWVSGLAFGLALSGLMSTFEKRQHK